MKNLIPLVMSAVALMAGSGCQPSPVKAVPDAKLQEDAQDQDVLGSVVSSYVAETRHWKPDEYVIKREREEDGLVTYRVSYWDVNAMDAYGNELSFAAIVDPNQKKVIKEMHYQ